MKKGKKRHFERGNFGSCNDNEHLLLSNFTVCKQMIYSDVNDEQMRHVITPYNFTLQCNKSKYICWTVSLANKHQQKLPSESNWMMEWNKWKETEQTGWGWRAWKAWKESI